MRLKLATAMQSGDQLILFTSIVRKRLPNSIVLSVALSDLVAEVVRYEISFSFIPLGCSFVVRCVNSLVKSLSPSLYVQSII
jgi:hypothetical protein